MASPPEISLPASTPEMAAYHDQESSDEPFAIYSLFDVDEDEITDIIKTCDEACEFESQVVRGRDDDFGKALSIGYHIGIHVRSDIDACALLRETEPAVNIKQLSATVYKALRAVPKIEAINGDLVSRESMADPVEASRHPTLHRRMFLDAEKLDYTQAGLT